MNFIFPASAFGKTECHLSDAPLFFGIWRGIVGQLEKIIHADAVILRQVFQNRLGGLLDPRFDVTVLALGDSDCRRNLALCQISIHPKLLQTIQLCLTPTHDPCRRHFRGICARKKFSLTGKFSQARKKFYNDYAPISRGFPPLVKNIIHELNLPH